MTFMHYNLSRQYRPQTFDSLVGQSSIVTTLKNALKLKKIAPAYIFCGPRGTGKTTLARLFAKALNCKEILSSIEPCNACTCCLDITQGKSFSVLEIDGASNRGIDDIRKLNETVSYSVLSGEYKVYIIDEVHMLTKEAFNALLKTLEEPPPNVKFLFATTEPQKVLPTIMSRCQRFDLKRLTIQEITKKLQTIIQTIGLDVEPEALELIAHIAEGGLRDAESILDQMICFTTGSITYHHVAEFVGMVPKQLYVELDQAIEKQQMSAPFILAKNFFSTGKDIQDFFEGLLSHFRTHLLYCLKTPVDMFLHPQEKEHYARYTAFYTQDHLLYILSYLMEWLKEIGKINVKRIFLEMIFLHLVQSSARLSLPSLVRRLEELSIQGSSLPAVDFHPIKKDHDPIPNAFHSSSLDPVTSPITVLEELKNHLPEALQPSIEEAINTQLAPDVDNQLLPPTRLPLEALALSETPTLFPQTPSSTAFTQPISVTDSSTLPSPLELGKTEDHLNTKHSAIAQESIRQEISPAVSSFHSSKYDTILRFAAVELEGILKKD